MCLPLIAADPVLAPTLFDVFTQDDDSEWQKNTAQQEKELLPSRCSFGLRNRLGSSITFEDSLRISKGMCHRQEK